MRYLINRDYNTLIYVDSSGNWYPFPLSQQESQGLHREEDLLEYGHCSVDTTAFGPLEEARSTTDWLEEFPVQILDPDGWRGVNALGWDVLITRREFAERVYISTVAHGAELKRLLEIENPVKWTADR